MSEFDKSFSTHDEEWNPGERIGILVAEWLESLDLDTVNEQYVVRVEVSKL